MLRRPMAGMAICPRDFRPMHANSRRCDHPRGEEDGCMARRACAQPCCEGVPQSRFSTAGRIRVSLFQRFALPLLIDLMTGPRSLIELEHLRRMGILPMPCFPWAGCPFHEEDLRPRAFAQGPVGRHALAQLRTREDAQNVSLLDRTDIEIESQYVKNRSHDVPRGFAEDG